MRPWGAMWHQLGPPSGAYWPGKRRLGPVGTVGKTWLPYSCHCALMSHFTVFFNMDPQTNDLGPWCYFRLSKISPLMGSHRLERSRFQASMHGNPRWFLFLGWCLCWARSLFLGRGFMRSFVYVDPLNSHTYGQLHIDGGCGRSGSGLRHEPLYLTLLMFLSMCVLFHSVLERSTRWPLWRQTVTTTPSSSPTTSRGIWSTF